MVFSIDVVFFVLLKLLLSGGVAVERSSPPSAPSAQRKSDVSAGDTAGSSCLNELIPQIK